MLILRANNRRTQNRCKTRGGVGIERAGRGLLIMRGDVNIERGR